ncbi:surfeit locus 1 family protein [Paucibacter oligotrophus]|uniref:SURF1-like protein n=1 Tax=Roseateles oligotrophus TaxID=1769250 RepID=A0A840LGI6_9BURK|nr:SURF1 family protein [Roseateles oligotrophus]MBB4846185.1 surfeit locus 1 family protein [Roseateles oligotrophus]
MSPRARFWLILAAALAAVALSARLGVWQLDRAAQKVALQEAVEQRAQLPALDAAQLSADAANAQLQLQRRVLLRGRWLSDKTVFLDNRPMDGRVGFFVVTPLRLSGRGEAILVQRGWVPRDARDRSRLPTLADSVAAEVEVQGRLALAPSRLYEFSAAASGPIRQNLDAAAYAQEIQQALLPLTVLQSGPVDPQDGLLRDWAAPDLGLQKHYGYAFQWFALSALLLGLYVWFQLIRPTLQRQAKPEASHGE